MKIISEAMNIGSCQLFSCQNFNENIINIQNKTCGHKGVWLYGYKVLTTPNCRNRPLHAHPVAEGTGSSKEN